MLAHTGEFPRLQTFDIPVRRLVLATLALMLAGATGIALRDSSPRRETAGTLVLSVGHRASHERRYFAEVAAMSPAPMVGRQSWDVRLTQRNHRRLTGAVVTARVWMPESGETSSTDVVGRYVGDGRYRFDVDLPKSGWWNVALDVRGRSGRDSVAFNVILP